MFIRRVMSPAQFEELQTVQNPVQQVLNCINAALAEPSRVPQGIHPYSIPFYYVDAQVRLCFEQAKELLRIVQDSGWKHVQIAYTPKYVEVRFSNDERHKFFPSWYEDEHGKRRNLTSP